uniref:ER membrane protein complex subunit 6 n=1 Tax=Zooxanthella nutricula TaxID=1333877 RepID=A0A7S2NGN3_9DINO|mmetsp:Transcript_27177/g.81958  ORF Transcript_27177/g.81958 Transcript_27177/m.81958 type:complete len:130 (+) Transcript_27177:70-459(+)
MPSKPGGKPGGGGGGGEPKRGRLEQKDEDGEFLNIMALQHNARALAHARVFSGVMAGCVAGLLRCEGLAGLFVFVFVTLAHSAMIFVKMSFQVQRHFPKPHDIFVSSFAGGIMSFILFWTLSFDVVHIF